MSSFSSKDTTLYRPKLVHDDHKLLKLLRSILHRAESSTGFIPICLILAVILRVGWIITMDVQPVSDFRWYYERGLDFATGQGYSIAPSDFWPENVPSATLPPIGEQSDGYQYTAYWPVGYPAFLGLLFTIFGSSLWVAKIANIVLYLGILIFSYYLAKRLFLSELTGRVTLLILTFYPDHIAYTSLLATEILFLFLFLLACTLLIIPKYQMRLAVISGVVFGGACLVKPQAIFCRQYFLAHLSWLI